MHFELTSFSYIISAAQKFNYKHNGVINFNVNKIVCRV